MTQRSVTVFGAYGHTGSFVVAELRKRGWRLILAGRDADKLNALGAAHAEPDIRTATVDDTAALDRALAGADAVINCAGPFAFTAGPVIEAALRARIPYLDVAAELEANLDTFKNYDRPARQAGVVVVPAMAFYGGLGDLLATAALDDWLGADEVSIAYGLDSWKPTPGTRAAGSVSKARRRGRRLVFSNGQLEYRTDAAPRARWRFPAPLGEQPVSAEFTMADTVTISHHVRVAQIRSYMTLAALEDLADESAEPPVAADGDGRSSQTFVVDVVVRSGGAERRASARGHDIYAISAPLIAQAAERVTSEPPRPGVHSAGELFAARDFLQSLAPEYLTLDFHPSRSNRS